MRVCVLDGSEIRDIGQIHDILAASLEFPAWYGRNLDALYDCLTDMREETEIRILHRESMLESLGGHGAKLGKVLLAAAEANPKVEVLDCPD